MSVTDEWPEYRPDLQIKVDITSGSMTLASPSALLNYSEFDLAAPEIRGVIYKNGAKQGSVTISSSTGALSASAVSVTTNDQIEIRFFALGRLSLPWFTRHRLERSVFFTVPAGNSIFLFDSSNNPMPVPAFDLTFGWDGNDNLKLGFKVMGDDGASQDLTVYTRLFGNCPNSNSSTVIDLDDTTNAQTHVSTFTKGNMDADAEVELHLKSGTGSTRQEDRVRIFFQLRDDLPTYNTSFPTSGTLIKQVKDGTGLKVYRP